MDPERWQRIESIFHKALDAGEDRRARVLVESCAGDESLRREVESLLAQHESAGEFMERPAFAGPAGAPVPPRPGSEDSHSAGIRPGRSSATTALWARSAAAVWALCMTRRT